MVTLIKTPKVFTVRVFRKYPYLRILTNLRGNKMSQRVLKSFETTEINIFLVEITSNNEVVRYDIERYSNDGYHQVDNLDDDLESALESFQAICAIF